MNIPFTAPNDDLNEKFIAQSEKEGLSHYADIDWLVA